MSKTPLLVNIYRSPKKDDMYLYVDKSDALGRVPEQLLALFGRPALVTTMLMTPEKKLARAQAPDVIQAIREKGFYLQMPPVLPEEMRELAEKNSKLGR